MIHRFAAALTALWVLAAVQTSAEVGSVKIPAFEDTTCGSEEWEPFVGRPYAEATAKIDQGALSYRLIRPNTAITMDVRMDRLNVYLDENDIITHVRCG